MTGIQGSGKSFISKIISEKYQYVRINQDTLKTKTKCIDMCKTSIKNNRSIIIDSTNPGFTDRNFWIDLAKKYKDNL